MTADLLVAAAGLVAATAVGWVIWRWRDRRFDAQVDEALALAAAMDRHPTRRRCACGDDRPRPERWLHRRDGCMPAREAVE